MMKNRPAKDGTMAPHKFDYLNTVIAEDYIILVSVLEILLKYLNVNDEK